MGVEAIVFDTHRKWVREQVSRHQFLTGHFGAEYNRLQHGPVQHAWEEEKLNRKKLAEGMSQTPVTDDGSA